MSYEAATEPVCTESQGRVALVVEPRAKDLGEFSVRRVLPALQRRMVGPFVFFDHMGPADFPPGHGIQVRPHPHIGIATITYLFEGEIMHRDSLGFEQPILPGAVNLMTAGRGIVHSERAGSDLDQHSRLHGIQSWIALPDGQEDIDPAFVHTPADALPQIDADGASVTLIMGSAFGAISPVTTYSSTLYLDCRLEAGARLALPTADELACYVVEGSVRIEERSYASGVMAIAAPGASLELVADTASRVMVLGGTGVGERHLWWNFVASTPEAIERAKRDWETGAFNGVDGDPERIPLPSS